MDINRFYTRWFLFKERKYHRDGAVQLDLQCDCSLSGDCRSIGIFQRLVTAFRLFK